eukprot:TRINITY_DN29312_c0_g2_i1.p1 TRINITY_DN29312_c0_g2~~TRINITY_DN29312_c0_g2_i1.p1  ORF type:complete len:202 (+),score=16.07 TRINITY_DN29312_c0_g2_i1:57-662(+)
MDGWLLKETAQSSDRKRPRQERSSGSNAFDHVQFSIDTARLAQLAMREACSAKAHVGVFALAPPSWAPGIAAIKQAQKCSKLPPEHRAPQIWAALVLALAEENISESEVALLRGHIKAVGTAAELEGIVTECQAWACKDGRTALSLVAKPSLNDLLGVVVRHVRHIGGEVRFSPAPPKKPERKVLEGIRLAENFLASRRAR